MNNKLALEAGLYPAGYNEEGEQEYIGTRQQWEKYQELENQNDIIAGVDFSEDLLKLKNLEL